MRYSYTHSLFKSCSVQGYVTVCPSFKSYKHLLYIFSCNVSVQSDHGTTLKCVVPSDMMTRSASTIIDKFILSSFRSVSFLVHYLNSYLLWWTFIVTALVVSLFLTPLGHRPDYIRDSLRQKLFVCFERERASYFRADKEELRDKNVTGRFSVNILLRVRQRIHPTRIRPAHISTFS